MQILCKYPWALTITSQAWGTFAFTPTPLTSTQGLLASLGLRQLGSSHAEAPIILGSKTQAHDWPKEIWESFQCEYLKLFFSRQAENGVETCLRFGETLVPLHFPTWLLPNHIQGLPRRLQGIWGDAPNERREEPRQQVSKASVFSRKWGGLAVGICVSLCSGESPHLGALSHIRRQGDPCPPSQVTSQPPLPGGNATRPDDSHGSLKINSKA